MINNNVVYTTDSGEQFLCSKEQADTLDVLKRLQKGGIGTIYGYKPSSGYNVSPEIDVQVITRISINALYQRKIEALNNIKFEDVEPEFKNEPKLAALADSVARELFDLRKQMLIDSMNKTLSGDRNDAMREGHDRNNISICHGVKVNLRGHKVNGIKVPLLEFDTYARKELPVAETILLQCIEISRKVIKEGTYKTVNSGAPVLMTDLIESKLNKRSVGLKSFSLDPAKFNRLVISKEEITKKDLVSAVSDMSMVDMILYLLEEYEK